MKLNAFVLIAVLSAGAAGQTNNKKELGCANNSGSVRLPMSVRANGPYVEVNVNGRGPFVFEVDTGSMTSPLASELAKEMGLEEPDSSNEHGVQIGLAKGCTVPMPLDLASFAGVWPLTGRHVYGGLGYPILKHFVVEFDYEDGYLTLYDPAKFEYSGKGTVFPAQFEMGYDPQIEGRLVVGSGQEIPVRFTLDTGAGGTVVSAPIVKAHNLFRIIKAKLPNPNSKPLVDGVDGLVFETTTARIAGIKLGDLVVDHPLVALSTDTDGPLAMDDIGVNLGGNVLSRFKVIVDYPKSRVILEPNRHFRDPFPSDASGLVLEANGPQFNHVVIHGVVQGSPADRSGLKEGDVITAIDGTPTEKYALWQIQDLLKQSGQTKKVTIQHGGEMRDVTLKLQALV